MIGIYKITNKINGKSYIGQSIDIDRRWSEHKRNIGSSKNPMYLDFKKYGLENFNFEIIEKCESKQLDDRERYWIQYYNTYNNGYNLTKGGQSGNDFYKYCNEIGEEESTLTTKQHLVFWFLLSKSFYEEGHYYVYKNAFQVKDAAAAVGISQPTWRTALDKLEELKYIKKFDKFYHIYIPNTYAPLDIELIRFLVQFGKEIKGGGAIVSVYSLIYKYWHLSGNHCEITVTQLRKLFNTQGKKQDTTPYRIMLNIFENEGLILTEHHERIYKGKPYIGYEIKYVNLKLPKGIKLDDYGPEDISDIVNTLEQEND